MKNYFFTISMLLLLQFPLQAQQTVTENLDQVESSKYITRPDDIKADLLPLMDTDSVTLITFSNCSGALLNHTQLSKKEVLRDLNMTGFKERYFILLIDNKAVIYMND